MTTPKLLLIGFILRAKYDLIYLLIYIFNIFNILRYYPELKENVFTLYEYI